MGFEVIASLKFLWDFLSPLFRDSLKSKFTSVSSEKNARTKAFNLYQTLESVCFATDEYITALDSFIATVPIKDTDNKLFRSSKESLLSAIDTLRYDLGGMIDLLNNMNIQMKIFLPEVLEELNKYRGNRDISMDISHRFGQLNQFSKKDIEELRDTLSQAKENNKIIKKELISFREFLADEFKFKESF